MALSDHVRAETRRAASRGATHVAHAGELRFRSSNDNHGLAKDEGRADELDCLRRVLASELLRTAELRARELGTGADQVLLRQGIIDEDVWLQRLAQHTGVAIETFAGVDRGDLPLSDSRIALAAELGLLPVARQGRVVLTLAPRRLAARRLCRLLRTWPHLAEGLRLTSSARLDQFLLHQADDVLGRAASDGLRNRFPHLSAAPRRPEARQWRRKLQRLKGPCGVAALLLLPPMLALDIWSALLALLFLAFAALRLWGSFTPWRPQPLLPRRPDRQLPVYTVIAALYREASSVAPLLGALDALDYPREKLQIILVLEPNDLATRAAVARFGPMPHLQVMIAPVTGPTTKPKALNCALPFARGAFTAVFDAEDRPEPRQLRRALDAFRTHSAEVACVQASLCINNFGKSWLTRMFAAEYAGQFDLFLPGFAAMRLPLPLGGSSNHFRTAVLRKVGGWDAWNVTEDADLGFRLARFGYRSVTFDSTTYEEAPVTFKIWFGQRSRWMKGWMQTWAVHMREPRRLWRETGWRGFVTLNVMVGGNVLTALAYPVLVIELAAWALSVGTSIVPGWFFSGPLAPLHIATAAAGLLSTAVTGLMGLSRRGRLRSGWILAATPLYWGCLSIAAWRALLELWSNPYHWEKTEHGATQGKPLSGSAPRHKRPTRMQKWPPHK
jgi:cellulose synthase/poly-beta-1,6-N-acetylglucosamine synthase-like glycosyltransferase